MNPLPTHNTPAALPALRSACIRLARVGCLALTFAAYPGVAADLPTGTPAEAGFSAERLARIDTLIEEHIRAGRVAGVSVAVARHGKLIHNQSYGSAELASGAPLQEDALFRLYSMTKPVASVALLTLYEKGLFQLTDPLDMYIPEFANLQVYAGKDASGNPVLESPKRKPTIQDAFRHTLGLASGMGSSDVDALYREAGLSMGALDSLRQEIERLASVPLLYHPGERWVYGLGHDVQAYLVEVLSGMPYEDYLQQMIFDPLDMEDTVFGVPADLKPRFATVYQRAADGTLTPDTADSYARFTDHAFATLSLSSSLPDYVRFAQMLLNGGELDGVRILGRKTVELMAQNHLPPNIPSISANGPAASGYGLGVSVTLDTAALGRPGSPGSFGWSGAATTTFSVNPAEDLVIVIMAQLMPNDTAIMNGIETLVYQALVD